MPDDLSIDRTLGGAGAGAKEKWSLAEGDSLGGYRVVKPLGRGGMGEVYLARHEQMGKLYALKLIAPGRAADEEFRKRFAVEARVMADLEHPNIVRVHYMGDEGGRFFLTMDYVEGPGGKPQSLAELLAERRKLPEPEARRIALDVAGALEYAHSFRDGVIHRDLKPGNILVDAEGRARVTDFGLAKVMGDEYVQSVLSKSVSTSLSAARTGAPGGGLSQSDGAIMGTVEYMAPEQKEGRTDARSDIFALGLIVYRMLTGRRAEGRFALPSKLGCAAQWDAIIERALAPVPADRYVSVPEMVRDIERVSMGRRSVGRKVALALVALGVLAAVGGGGFFLYRDMARRERLRVEEAQRAEEEAARLAAEADRRAAEAERARAAEEAILRVEEEKRRQAEAEEAAKEAARRETEAAIASLLDAARTFREAGSLHEALAKAKEALAADPQNGQAQALLHTLEEELKSRRVEEEAARTAETARAREVVRDALAARQKTEFQQALALIDAFLKAARFDEAKRIALEVRATVEADKAASDKLTAADLVAPRLDAREKLEAANRLPGDPWVVDRRRELQALFEQADGALGSGGFPNGLRLFRKVAADAESLAGMRPEIETCAAAGGMAERARALGGLLRDLAKDDWSAAESTYQAAGAARSRGKMSEAGRCFALAGRAFAEHFDKALRSPDLNAETLAGLVGACEAADLRRFPSETVDAVLARAPLEAVEKLASAVGPEAVVARLGKIEMGRRQWVLHSLSPAVSDPMLLALPSDAVPQALLFRWKVLGKGPMKLPCPAVFLAFSSDGRFLACYDRKLARAVDVRTGGQVQTTDGPKDYVRTCAFSPCGRFLACVNSKYDVVIGDLRGEAAPRILARYVDHRTKIGRLLYAPGGASLQCVATNGRVFTVDAATGSRTPLSKWTVGNILHSSADGRRILIESPDRGKQCLRVLQTQDFGSVYTLRWDFMGEERTPGRRILSSDGRFVYVARRVDYKSRILQYDTRSGEMVGSYPGTRNCYAVFGIAVSRDGNTLAYGSWRDNAYVDTRSGQHLERVDANSYIQYLEFSPDGRTIAYVDERRQVLLKALPPGLRR